MPRRCGQKASSPDPAGLAALNGAHPANGGANPQTWDANAYVANQPLTATDPLGLDCSGPQYAADGPLFLNCPASYPTSGGINPTSGMSSTMAAAYNAYASWMSAVFQTGGAQVSFGTSYNVAWSIEGGAYWAGPNGENVDSSETELGLQPLPGPAASSDSSPQFASPSGGQSGGGGCAACGPYSAAVVQACEQVNAAMVKARTGITPTPMAGTYDLGGGLDFNFFLPGASEATVPHGRFPLSQFNNLTGLGPAGHFPGPGTDFSRYKVIKGGLEITSHVDDGLSTLWPFRPLGIAEHLTLDVFLGGLFGLRPPCP